MAWEKQVLSDLEMYESDLDKLGIFKYDEEFAELAEYEHLLHEIFQRYLVGKPLCHLKTK